jgi:hypothetical protein
MKRGLYVIFIILTYFYGFMCLFFCCDFYIEIIFWTSRKSFEPCFYCCKDLVDIIFLYFKDGSLSSIMLHKTTTMMKEIFHDISCPLDETS